MASPFAMIDHVRDLLELRQRWSREARAHVDRAIAKLDLEFETGHGSYEEYLAALREVADAMVREPIPCLGSQVHAAP